MGVGRPVSRWHVPAVTSFGQRHGKRRASVGRVAVQRLCIDWSSCMGVSPVVSPPLRALPQERENPAVSGASSVGRAGFEPATDGL
jgi:hypothetical protein